VTVGLTPLTQHWHTFWRWRWLWPYKGLSASLFKRRDATV